MDKKKKWNIIKRITSILLVILLVVSVLPTGSTAMASTDIGDTSFFVAVESTPENTDLSTVVETTDEETKIDNSVNETPEGETSPTPTVTDVQEVVEPTNAPEKEENIVTESDAEVTPTPAETVVKPEATATVTPSISETPKTTVTVSPTVKATEAPKKADTKRATKGALTTSPVVEEEESEEVTKDGSLAGSASFSTGSYTHKTVSTLFDLTTYPKSANSTTLSPVTGYGKQIWNLTNSKMITKSNGIGFGVNISDLNNKLKKSKANKKAVTFSNVGTIRLEKVAKSLSDGRYVDLVLSIDEIGVYTWNPQTKEYGVSYPEINGTNVFFVETSTEGVGFWAGSIRDANNTKILIPTELLGTFHAYTYINASASIFYTGTNERFKNANMAYTIGDLDARCGAADSEEDKAFYSEGVSFGTTGWGSDIYTQENSDYLKITNSNATYKSWKAEGTNYHGELAGLTAFLTGNVAATIQWTGTNNCGNTMSPRPMTTPITDVSLVKKINDDGTLVDEVETTTNASVLFQFPLEMDYTTKVSQLRYFILTDNFDKIFNASKSTIKVQHYEPESDTWKTVTGNWRLVKEGNKVVVASGEATDETGENTKSATLQRGGQFRILIKCPFVSNAQTVLQGSEYEKVTRNGATYAKIPNTATYRATGQKQKGTNKTTNTVNVYVPMIEENASMEKKIVENSVLVDEIITTVDKKVVFRFPITMEKTNADTQMRFFLMTDQFDKVFDLSKATYVIRDNENKVTPVISTDLSDAVAGKWFINPRTTNKLYVYSGPTEEENVGNKSATLVNGGSYRISVTIPFKQDALTTLANGKYEVVERDGQEYYVIPNMGKYRATPQTKTKGTNTPTETVNVLIPKPVNVLEWNTEKLISNGTRTTQSQTAFKQVGDLTYYDIKVIMPDTDENTCFTSVKVVDDLDSRIQVDSSKTPFFRWTKKDGTEVSGKTNVDSKWSYTITGNHVEMTSTDVVDGGIVHCMIPVRITKDSLDGDTITIDGVTYANIPNKASVTVTDKLGKTKTIPTDQVYIRVPGTGISLTKKANPTKITAAEPGNTIQYTFQIKNTGHFTLTNVTLNDKLAGVQNVNINWAGSSNAETGEGVLAPGETVSATASYAITANDIDAKKVVNPATVTGTDPEGQKVSADASATTTLLYDTYITLEKTANPTYIENPTVGQTITYTFTGTNGSNVTLSNVVITDEHEGLSSIAYTWPNVANPGVLLAGETVTGTATYHLTQDDIDAGFVHNDAVITGTDPLQKTVTDTASADVTLARNPSIQVTKDADKKEIPNAKVDDVISYTIEGTNTGNVTLYNVTLVDELEGTPLTLQLTWPGTEGVLASGEVVTGTATYAVKQENINAGKVKNDVTITGKTKDGQTLTDDDTVTTTLGQNASIKVTKTADKEQIANAKVGDVINYTIVGENTGNVTLSSVKLVDTIQNNKSLSLNVKWNGQTATLLPGEKVNATASYSVTQEDIDAGKVHNVVTIEGTAPNGVKVTDDDDADTTLGQAPSIKVTKTANPTEIKNAKVGDVINYTIVGENTGNVTLDPVTLVDRIKDGNALTLSVQWPKTDAVLAPGAKVNATASYQVTQEDINKGLVVNTVTIEGTAPGGAKVTDSDEAKTTLDQSAAIKVTKKADPQTIENAKEGDTINYTIVGENIGNVILTEVALADQIKDGDALTLTIQWPGTEKVLAPGEKVNATASYKIKQSDINKGLVKNTVTIEGQDPKGAKVTDDDEADTILGQAAAIKVTKIADPTAIENAKVGDIINYTIVGENTGNVILKEVALADQIKDGDVLTLNIQWTGTEKVLVPGEKVNATASYKVTQEDIDNGIVTNTVTIEGQAPNGGKVTDDDEADTILGDKPSIKVTKTADKAVIENATASDTITYTIVGENTCNTTLFNVSLVDTIQDSKPLSLNVQWEKQEGVLAPGEKVSATATYAITQDDIDSSNVHNVVTIEGTTAKGVKVTDNDDADTKLGQSAKIKVTKVADPSAIQNAKVGDIINYTIVGENIGNVTLQNVTLTDKIKDGQTLFLNKTWDGKANILLPGEKVTATASYVVTQNDINKGLVTNTVTIEGTAPNKTKVTDNAEADTTLGQSAAIKVTKTADKTAIENAKVGDIINYTIVGENIGNVILTEVALADQIKDGDVLKLTIQWPETEKVLAPGAKVTATASYKVTQKDINNSVVTNTVTIEGTAPNGTKVEDDDKVDTDLGQTPAIDVEKTADKKKIENAKPGDVINYTIVGKNTGNVALTNVSLVDELKNSASADTQTLALTLNWEGATNEGKLLPGETVTATGKYTLTQTDIDAGKVINHVLITGEPPKGTPVEDEDDEETELPATPSIQVEKTADRTLIENATPGDVIKYQIVGTNTGNVTLKNVTLVDGLVKLDVAYSMDKATKLTLTVDWSKATEEGVLLPGEKVTATCSYTLTQADINAGGVVNHVIITGEPPKGTPVEDEDDETTKTPGTTDIFVQKEASTKKIENAKPSDTIRYSIVGVNVSNVTLHDVTLTDKLVKKGELVSGSGAKTLTLTIDWSKATSEGVLAPGEKVTATYEYAITQADIDAGGVVNHIFIEGTAPNNDKVTDEDEVETETVQNPGISVIKTPDKQELKDAKVGDIVKYDIVGTNTGNVTLKNVSLRDVLTAGDASVDDETAKALTLNIDWSKATAAKVLAPGEKVYATCEYALTQADIDAGKIVNHVFITGEPPEGPPIGDEDNPPVPVEQKPAIKVVKTPDKKELKDAQAGDIVTYTIVGENTGNVTLKNVTLRDVLVAGDASVDDETAKVLSLNVDWTKVKTEKVLLPGEKVYATCTYALTQADIDAGKIVNHVFITGEPPEGPPVTDEDEPPVPVEQKPAISVVKTPDNKEMKDAKVGDVVKYEIVGTNIGNVTLKNVTLRDVLVAGKASVDDETAKILTLKIDWSKATAEKVLAPGEDVYATCEYALTQADIDAGEITNHVFITGEPPEGPPVTDEDEPPVPVEQKPAISVEKTADQEVIEKATAGTIVKYTIVGKNTGNVTLKNVTLLDELVKKGEEYPSEDAKILNLNIDWSKVNKEGTLLPGEVVTATYEYALTQEDINAGGVVNHVTITGEPPEGDPVEDDDEVTTKTPGDVSIIVDKEADQKVIENAKVGDIIHYTIVGKNTGNVTLSNVTLVDALVKKGMEYPTEDAVKLELTIDWSEASEEGVLLPGEIVKATCEYALTQEDINAGGVVNHILITGEPPKGDPVEDEDDEETETPQNPSIKVIKTPDHDEMKDAKVGDKVTYAIVGENTGNVTLTNVSLRDILVTGDAKVDEETAKVLELVLDWTQAKEEGILLPGEKVYATCEYALTQEDIDAGLIVNHVFITGEPPEGPPVTDEDEPPVPVEQKPAIKVVKTPDKKEIKDAKPGDKVMYAIVGENTGNVTLTHVTLTDQLTKSGVELPSKDAKTMTLNVDWSKATAEGVLLPGEKVYATVIYVLTQADIDAGGIVNHVFIKGTPPKGDPPEDHDDPPTELPENPSIKVTKDADKTDIKNAKVGEVITYSFKITNTGNVTLKDVALADSLEGISTPVIKWPDKKGILAPGESATATATYKVTETDIKSGKVVNVAVAIGTSPKGKKVRDNDDATTKLTAPTPTMTPTPTPKIPPQTGDTNNTMLYIILAILAIGCIVAVFAVRAYRKKKA